MSVYATSKILLDESVRMDGESGYTMRLKYRINGITRDADYIAKKATIPTLNPIDFAPCLPMRSGTITGFDGSTIVDRPSPPQRGDKAKILIGFNGTSGSTIDVYCLQTKTIFVPGNPPSPDNCLVTVDFGELGWPIIDSADAGVGSSNTYKWLVGLNINGNTVPVRTNYGWATSGTNESFNSLLQVWYRPGVAGYDGTASPVTTAAQVAAGTTYSQYCNIPSLEPITNFQYIVREIIHPAHSEVNCRSIEAKIAYFNGSVNQNAIWGFGARTLRMRAIPMTLDVYRSLYIVNPDAGIGSQIINGRSLLREVAYNFEHRPRGWDEVCTLKEPWTGFEFPDTDDPATGIIAGQSIGNGWRKFSNGYRIRDYAKLGLPDMRTF